MKISNNQGARENAQNNGYTTDVYKQQYQQQQYQQPYAQQQYQEQQYQQPYQQTGYDTTYMQQDNMNQPADNKLGLIAMALSIAGIFCCCLGGVLNIAGVILGCVSLKKSRNKVFSIIAIIVGIVGIITNAILGILVGVDFAGTLDKTHTADYGNVYEYYDEASSNSSSSDDSTYSSGGFGSNGSSSYGTGGFGSSSSSSSSSSANNLIGEILEVLSFDTGYMPYFERAETSTDSVDTQIKDRCKDLGLNYSYEETYNSINGEKLGASSDESIFYFEKGNCYWCKSDDITDNYHVGEYKAYRGADAGIFMISEGYTSAENLRSYYGRNTDSDFYTPENYIAIDVNYDGKLINGEYTEYEPGKFHMIYYGYTDGNLYDLYGFPYGNTYDGSYYTLTSK